MIPACFFKGNMTFNLAVDLFLLFIG